ncbi:MAG: hypothetical protein D6806_14840 [Deltaproteobacteria bacterium]|nr:MAG: hypothetical protein D6806_14840 [Deltaproteobacteria bacterium]
MEIFVRQAVRPERCKKRQHCCVPVPGAVFAAPTQSTRSRREITEATTLEAVQGLRYHAPVGDSNEGL